MLALTGGAVCDRVHRMLLGCVCFKIDVTPLVLQACWGSIGWCLRPLLLGCVCSICFTNILVLTEVAVCDSVHRMLLGCVCLKINVFPLVLQYVSSHWGCCLRPCTSYVVGVRLLQNQCVPISFTSVLALSWVVSATDVAGVRLFNTVY